MNGQKSKEKGKTGLRLPIFQRIDPLPSIQPSTSSPVSPQNEDQCARLLSPTGENDGIANQLKHGVEYINIGQEDQSELYGYRRSVPRTGVTWGLIFLTAGFLRLIFHWAPQWMLKATHVRCSFREATRVLVVEQYKKYKRYFVKDVQVLSADKVRYDQQYSALRSGVSVVPQKNGMLGTQGNFNLQDINSKNGIFSKPKHLVIPTASGQMKDVKEIRWFSCKKLSYIWDPEAESFYKLSGLDHGQTLSDLHSFQGFSWLEQLRRRIVYGENAIKVPVTPVLKLLFLEALNPFYIFQVFSVCLWFSDDYIYYASVIVITSVLSIISEVYQMHKNQKSLSSTIQSHGVIEVVRENGQSEVIPTDHLVPGDVIIIPPQGCTMQCDAALLQGTAIVNESMLTGESVPVTKTPVLNRVDTLFKEKEHSRHVLFCGTQVIQTRFYGNERVTAVILRTGFLTSKGALVRSIMYPPPVDFKFQQDAYKFILFLVGIASFGFIYTVVNKLNDGLTASQIAVDSLDLITIVVPPALPMAMTVGILYALQRLKRFNIFCISPRSINISGVLNCVCFDKTGTLTEDGLDMKGVVDIGVENNELVMGELRRSSSLSELPKDHLLFGMAACHSITIIDREMVGDPLDLKMFESTTWILEEPGNEDTSKYDMIMPSIVRPAAPTGTNQDLEEDLFEIGILRQFPFSSRLQRMSVITRKLSDSNFILYCKGSPEMIASLSKPETIPTNFQDILFGYTQKGFRVLALGWKELKLSYPKAHRISREEVENDLNFVGLLVLENRLKEETKPVIQQLKNANIKTIMVTGDNMLTALSVGRECDLVNPNDEVVSVTAIKDPAGESGHVIQFESTSIHQATLKISKGKKGDSTAIDMSDSKYCFAIEGKSWAVIHSQFPDLLKKLVVRGSIFARMSPDQKQQLVMELQNLGYYVGMCGDGANDCGALKSAHAGISLSQAEASVASPFTSKTPDISCVPTLIREGRTALVTSFGVFKYMATYSLTQFISVMILYSIHSNLTDIQFLYIDLFLITVFAFFFGRTESYQGPLASTPPASSLISVAPILSIFLHMMIIIFFQTFSFFYVQDQSWFVPFNTTTADEIYAGHENYAVYSISQFQYIILAVVFAKGPPYRKPLYTNYYFTGSVLIMTGFSIFLTVAPSEWFIEVFELVMPPEDDTAAAMFRWQIIIFAVVNSLLAIMAEYLVVDYFIYRKLKCRCTSEKKTKKKYLAIEAAMQKDGAWPKLTQMDPMYNDKIAHELALNPKKLINNSLPAAPEKKDQPGVVVMTQYHSSL